MNSHTKPRHENKQDLIYLLPVSRQMPGWAGGTVGRGGPGTSCGWNLAWDSQEGTIPFTSRTPQQPRAMSPRPATSTGVQGMGTVAVRTTLTQA